jgi:hypothetical protein
MPREITEEQLARVLLDINRIIGLGTSHAEQAEKYPLTPLGVWSKENQKMWEEDFHHLLAMASVGNFSEALDALHEELGRYRDDPK